MQTSTKSCKLWVHVACADIPMGICSWRVVIASTQDLTALYEALRHEASAMLTTTSTHAANSKCMQKTCNATFYMTNAITLCIANFG